MNQSISAIAKKIREHPHVDSLDSSVYGKQFSELFEKFCNGLADEIEQAHERPLKEIGKILIDIALNPDSHPQNCISAIASIVRNELEN